METIPEHRRLATEPGVRPPCSAAWLPGSTNDWTAPGQTESQMSGHRVPPRT